MFPPRNSSTRRGLSAQTLGMYGSKLFAMTGGCADDDKSIEMLDLDNEEAGWRVVGAELPLALRLLVL